MNTSEKENKTEELTESQKRQIAFGRKLMASKREMQEEARREYEENPEIQLIFQQLKEKNTQVMDTIENKTEELTESQKKQIAFGRKLMAAKRATQKEAERHLDMPETKALLDKLSKKLNDGAK